MAKQGEKDYLRNIGEGALQHALNKPFSDPDCGALLMEIGAVMALLPPPPGKLLDLGCGTGWTSRFFARRGYTATGQDISPDAVRHATERAQAEGLDNLCFVESDYEALAFVEAFDCAVFFSSLHHATDEAAAMRAVYRALRPGGVCVTSEPGYGHAASAESRQAARDYGVTEKDMPPALIRRLGRAAGFREFAVYPHADALQKALYAPGPVRMGPGLIRGARTWAFARRNGIVWMRK
ncbi:MAG: class I SAM-dependent methyltransferase [Candidatus Hydrogenedentes bacterium]|nr:class I SAM-dependent methyltransferase [Candidatus Hydrogenedentota bacterium]